MYTCPHSATICLYALCGKRYRHKEVPSPLRVGEAGTYNRGHIIVPTEQVWKDGNAAHADTSMSRPLNRGPAISSTPLLDIQVFRPGSVLALSILLLPALAALVGAVFFILMDGRIPEWLPFLALLWIPCAPIFWLAMQSVRTNAVGVAAGRPWSSWVEIPWTFIERVEQFGPLITITGSNARRITFAPMLLSDGQRLKRSLLLRLPSQVLIGKLSRDQQRVLRSGFFMPDAGLSGTLHTHPHRRWRILFGGVALVLAGLAVLVTMTLPLALSIPLALLCVVGMLAASMAMGWLLQELLVNEKGMSLSSPITRQSYDMSWSEVDIIEHSPYQFMLRLRGARRMLCAGPPLLPAGDRDIMQAFLREYCLNNGVPFVARGWFM